jgi:uncharacterized membrane protein YesL
VLTVLTVLTALLALLALLVTLVPLVLLVLLDHQEPRLHLLPSQSLAQFVTKELAPIIRRPMTN